MQRYNVTVNDRERIVELVSLSGDTLDFSVDGERFVVRVQVERSCFQSSATQPAALPTTPKTAPRTLSAGQIAAPMPGMITKVLVKVGATVAIGQPVVLLEAMKMENSVVSTAAGVVAEVLVKAGDEVASGGILVKIEPAK